MKLREGLGYKYLSQQEQQTYKLMLKAFSVMADSIDCSGISRDVDTMKVLQTVLGDNPSVIYFNKTNIQIEKNIHEKRMGSSVIERRIEKQILLKNVLVKSQAEKMNLALEKAAEKIALSIKTASNDNYSLLLNLYEYLQKNVRYDKKEFLASTRGKTVNLSSHNAYGALINKLAVCDGFSSAFVLLAQKLGLQCMLVFGSSAYSTKKQENHAWNIIKVQNKYYHMDITWDARRYEESTVFSYSYFALTDKETASDHGWNKTAAPVCSFNNLSYYLKNGLYANNIEELKEIIKSNVRKNTKVFQVKISRSFKLPNNAGNYLAQIVLKEITKPGMQSKASYGWNENTRCFYAKIFPLR